MRISIKPYKYEGKPRWLAEIHFNKNEGSCSSTSYNESSLHELWKWIKEELRTNGILKP